MCNGCLNDGKIIPFAVHSPEILGMNNSNATPAMRTTMADIARECGVTKMTVSRVLAGGDRVKPATRDRVLATAKRLNYEINALAQNLTQGRSGFIGVATPFEGLLGDKYFGEAFKGFNEVLKDTEMDFALFDTMSDSFNDGIKLMRLYRQRRVDGLLIVAAHTSDGFLDTLGPSGVPMVIVGEKPRPTGICSITCDNVGGINLMCQHLYDLGHRKIAFVEGPNNFTTAIRRKESYIAFCQNHGLEIPEDYIFPGYFTVRGGREAGRKLLKLKNRPTAIITANDPMAFGVIESTRELSLRVPEDVSIAGFDDLYTASEYFPALTTIHQPVYEMGKIGAQLLMDSISQNLLPQGLTRLDVSLVVRDSTGAPPRSSRG